MGAQRALLMISSKGQKFSWPLRATDSLLSEDGEVGTFSSVALDSALLPKSTPSQASSGMLISGGSQICR